MWQIRTPAISDHAILLYIHDYFVELMGIIKQQKHGNRESICQYESSEEIF